MALWLVRSTPDVYVHNNQLPKNLSDIFSANYQIHSYGTRHADDCHLPRKSTTLGQYSWAFQGPKIWNSIDSVEGSVASWVVRSTPCSWARHFTLTVPLST